MSTHLASTSENSVESPGKPSAPEVRAAATRLEFGLKNWLGPDDPRIARLIGKLELRRRLLVEVDDLRAEDSPAGAGARARRLELREKQLAEAIQDATESLDQAMNDGLRQRIGYRLGLLDRHIFQELIRLGASGKIEKVAVCQHCVWVFEPRRKSTAARCDRCAKHPPPRWEKNGHKGFAYPRMRFDRDPLSYDGTVFDNEAQFIGWTAQRISRCTECGETFFHTRKDNERCGNACKQARSKRRANGDTDELGPEAKRRKDDYEEYMRECFGDKAALRREYEEAIRKTSPGYPHMTNMSSAELAPVPETE